MDVNVLKDDGRKMKFVLEDATPQFANSLRRTMIGKVPTMAIEEVDFINNTSGLFDEIIAHRMGMIPWKFPVDEYNLPEECDCDGEGCPQCQVEMVLKKEGESFVKAKNIKPTDKKVENVNPEILIVKLLEDQEIELEARANLGIGKDHAKFQAATAAYRYYPTVRINGEEVENSEEAANVAPKPVKKAEGAVEADEEIVYAMENTVDIEEGDEVELEEDEDRFIFTVESVSGLTTEQIVTKAVDILKEETEEFEEEIGNVL